MCSPRSATAVSPPPKNSKAAAGDIDFEAEGLLEGTADKAAVVARTRLVEHLLEEGVALEVVKDAVREKRLMLLPIELATGGDLKHTAAEVAKQSGIDMELFLDLRRSLGLAEPPLEARVFSDYDLAVAIAIKNFIEMGVSLESVREINRVMGASMAQLASTVERVLVREFLRPDEDEYEIAMRFSRVARSMTPEFGFVLQHIHNLHLREQTRIDVLGNPAVELLSDAREMTVCFADLVSFTAIGMQVPPDELSEIASRLIELTAELVQPPVRFIKAIGDAVMLASAESVPLIETALNLLAAVQAEGEGFPQLRIGIGTGEVIVRNGDIYGPPVNLASRLCDVAKPSSVLTDARIHEMHADNKEYTWSYAGRRHFKNIAEPVEGWRLRRTSDARKERRAQTAAARSENSRSTGTRSGNPRSASTRSGNSRSGSSGRGRGSSTRRR